MTDALTLAGMEGREAVDRFHWVRVIRRIRFGRRRTGLRATVLTLASFANAHGGNVYPSVETLASATEQGRRTVLRHLALLRDVYRLVGRISRGGGRGRGGVASRYQLTLPEDALDRFAMTDPDHRPAAPSAPDHLAPAAPLDSPVRRESPPRDAGPPGRHLHLVR